MTKIIYIVSIICIFNITIYSQNITITGSNTMFQLVKSIATSYSRSQNTIFTIHGEGTGVGIQDFITKKNNIAMLSRQLHKDEIEALKKQNINYEIYPLALDALCIIVNSRNRLNYITFDDLENVYNGTIKFWSYFDDEKIGIKPIIRDTKSGTAEFFKESLMKKSNISPGCAQFSNTSSIIYAVGASNEYIGYVGCAFVDENIKALALKSGDGNVIEPSEANIKSRKYPLYRDLYLMYDKNNTSVLDFINYCKSERGQKLIESNGFLLLTNP